MRRRFTLGKIAVVICACVLAGAGRAASLKDEPALDVYYALRDDNGDGRADLLGKAVTLHGALTMRPFQTNGAWVTFFQDDSGGLRLVDRSARLANRNSGRPNFDEGDEIKVRGIVGVDELIVEDAQLIGNGEAPKPRDVWASDLTNNRLQSQLVRVIGEVTRGPRDKEIEFFVRDVTGQTPLVLKSEFLMADKGEFSYRLWKGGPINARGSRTTDSSSRRVGRRSLRRLMRGNLASPISPRVPEPSAKPARGRIQRSNPSGNGCSRKTGSGSTTRVRRTGRFWAATARASRAAAITAIPAFVGFRRRWRNTCRSFGQRKLKSKQRQRR